MAKKQDSVCCATLFTAAISGIALASVMYMFLPTHSLALLCQEKSATLGQQYFLLLENKNKQKTI